MNTRSVALFLGTVGLMAGTVACSSKPETNGVGEGGAAKQEAVESEKSAAAGEGGEAGQNQKKAGDHSEGGEGGEG